MSGVSDIKKLDKYQIQISLAAPDADFPFVLTDYRLLMVPADFKDWSKPVGTGAFVLDKFDPGVRIALKKANGDYWKEGRGHLEAAEITVIGDGARTPQCAGFRSDRHHQPRRSQGRRAARQGAQDRKSCARRAAGTRSWRWKPTRRLTTMPTSGWR